MKNIKITVILISALLLGLLFTACGRNTAAPAAPDSPIPAAVITPTESAPSSPSSSPETSSSPSAAVTSSQAFTFEEKTYSGNGISIKYPQLTGMSDSTAQERINKLIAGTALLDMGSRPSDEEFTDYELGYKVTLNTPAVISLYFDGYANVSGAAHPYQFLRALTLDIAKREAVPLTSLVTINEGFIDVLLSGTYTATGYDMTPEYEESIKNYLKGTDTETWLEQLRNADTSGSDTFSYLTDGALVISVPVPHVMGDHIEISLPFKTLHGYQTDNPMWHDIEQ